MHAAQKEFLEDRYATKDWHGRSESGRRLIKAFPLEGSELKGWKLLKAKHAEQEGAKLIRSMWSHGDNMSEVLSIDVFVCGSVKAAHEAEKGEKHAWRRGVRSCQHGNCLCPRERDRACPKRRPYDCSCRKHRS